MAVQSVADEESVCVVVVDNETIGRNDEAKSHIQSNRFRFFGFLRIAQQNRMNEESTFLRAAASFSLFLFLCISHSSALCGDIARMKIH